MYALASFGVPWAPGLCACILRGRRGTWCYARGRMRSVDVFVFFLFVLRQHNAKLGGSRHLLIAATFSIIAATFSMSF